MRVMILGIIAILLLAGCTKPDEAKRVLTNEGYTNIEITGYNLFACSDEDTFKTGFRAKNRNGKIITGTVCSGVLKGSTIRY